MNVLGHCDACGDSTASLHDTDAGQQVCPDCYTLTLKVERDAARKQLRGAVDALEAVREQLDTDPLLVALGDRLSTLRAIVDADHRP
jgi:coenzyme F420-reducing hydrogenase beta subunit